MSESRINILLKTVLVILLGLKTVLCENLVPENVDLISLIKTSTSTDQMIITSTLTSIMRSTSKLQTLKIIRCNTNTECPPLNTCWAKICLPFEISLPSNTSPITDTPLVSSSTFKTTTTYPYDNQNPNYNQLNDGVISPLLWALIIVLPSIIIIILVIVLVIYCRNSCRLTNARRRHLNRHATNSMNNSSVSNDQVSNPMSIFDLMQQNPDTYYNFDTSRLYSNAPPPMYKDLSFTLHNSFNKGSNSSIDNKDIIYDSDVEHLPSYGTWSKSHTPVF